MRTRQRGTRSARGLAGAAALGLLVVLGCAPAPATPAPAGDRAASSAGAAAASPGAATVGTPSERPEVDALNVAVAATGSSYLPLQVAVDGGYLQEQGLNVSTSVVSASTAAQALVAGSMDLYQGGATGIAARLGGGDVIYIAAAVDRSTLVLFGQKGITSFPQFRGRPVATTAVGAFGEIALNQTAKEFGMVPGQDFTILFNPGPEAALSAFLSGAADGLIVTPPQTLEAESQGYPVVIDYYQRGLRINGPAMTVVREFAQTHPNTVRAYLRGYLAGLKRTLDDRDYALTVNRKYTRSEDPSFLEMDYEIGKRVWNKDMTVERSAVEVVLQNSPLPNARDANPDDFYDNRWIAEVNATYARQLFPEAFAPR
jgi:ABC-type nitrate/sulfonate/bicarbonate transport system substrate-binding protein